MKSYYVNEFTDNRGDHEVHSEGCFRMPSNKKYLGRFDKCQDAVTEAKKTYRTANGCIHCSTACHTS